MDGVIFTIAGMSIVTLLPRLLPMLHNISSEFRYLKYVPVAIFSSLVFPELLLNEHRMLTFDIETVAGIAAFLVAWRSRNLLLTMLVGVAVLYILKHI